MSVSSSTPASIVTPRARRGTRFGPGRAAVAGRLARHARRRPARPHVLFRGPGDGLSRRGARSRCVEPCRRGGRPPSPCRVRRRGRADRTRAPVRGRVDRVRERAGREPRLPRAFELRCAVRTMRRDRAGSRGREGVSGRMRRAGGAARRDRVVGRTGRDRRCAARHGAARHPEDGPAWATTAKVRCGSPTRTRSGSRTRTWAASPACSRSACRSPTKCRRSSRAARTAARSSIRWPRTSTTTASSRRPRCPRRARPPAIVAQGAGRRAGNRRATALCRGPVRRVLRARGRLARRQ